MEPITFDYIFTLYEMKFKKKLSSKDKKLIIDYETDKRKAKGMSTKELLLLKDIKNIQITILEISGEDKLSLMIP